MDRFEELVRDLPPAELSALIDRANRLSQLKRFGAPAVAIVVGAVVALALSSMASGMLLEYATIIGGAMALAAFVILAILLRQADKRFERDVAAAQARARTEARSS